MREHRRGVVIGLSASRPHPNPPAAGEASAVAYDDRGSAIWTARQMAIMPFGAMYFEGDMSGNYPGLVEGSGPSELHVTYDEEPGHTYIRTSEYDHAGRGRRLTLPLDPDFDGPGLGGGPVVSGELELDPRGLPIGATAYVGEEPIRVLGVVDYDQEGQVETRSWGGTAGLLDEAFEYDIRNRPIRHEAVRTPTMGAMAGTIGAVEYVAREQFGWDEGSNLIEIRDTRPVSQWAEGRRPRNTYIGHDSLYRVAQVSYEYRGESGYGTDLATDWRDDAEGPNADDPMRPRPAEMIGQSHGSRIQQLDYEWDYLGNQIRWLDDAFEAESLGEMFYERGIGEITNGNTPGASASSTRPSALYLSTNIDAEINGGVGVDPSWNGAGWVEVEYGTSGNVASFTVHGQCHDASLEDQCTDSTGTVAERADHFREVCACAQEQHYRYRWDELNRLVEGLRYDRDTGGDWTYGARLRYRYDGANQRTVKQSYAASNVNVVERHALYVYPGDFERRGLTIGFGNAGPTYQAVAGTADATETQYLIAGARIVWDGEPSTTGPGIDRNRRATVSASDLLGTTAASLDLESGALLEVSTYYPNGARENLWANEADVPLEPMGFTGKEADEEIGVTYFGERWLIPRLGRWATPDPLHVHAAGGGEELNAYHYVSGNLLQAVDALGLSACGPDISAEDCANYMGHAMMAYGMTPQDLGQSIYNATAADNLAGQAAGFALGWAESEFPISDSGGVNRLTSQHYSDAPDPDPLTQPFEFGFMQGRLEAMTLAATLGMANAARMLFRWAANRALRAASQRLLGALDDLGHTPRGVGRGRSAPAMWGPQDRTAPMARLADYINQEVQFVYGRTLAFARGTDRLGRPVLVVAANEGHSVTDDVVELLRPLAERAGLRIEVAPGRLAGVTLPRGTGHHAEIVTGEYAAEQGIELVGMGTTANHCGNCQGDLASLRRAHPDLQFESPMVDQFPEGRHPDLFSDQPSEE